MNTTRRWVGALLSVSVGAGLCWAAPVSKVPPSGKAAATTNKVAAVAGDPEFKEGLNNNVPFPLLPKPVAIGQDL